MNRNQIFELVEADVMEGLADIFVPSRDVPAPFDALSVDDFTFSKSDIPNGAEVTAVAWQLLATNLRPMIATGALAYNGTPIPALLNRTLNRDEEIPDHLALVPLVPGLRETLRDVKIAGVTLVVLRSPASEDAPMLLRFVDWADVYAQLGFTFSTRPPEVADDGPGFQRISEVPAGAGS